MSRPYSAKCRQHASVLLAVGDSESPKDSIGGCVNAAERLLPKSGQGTILSCALP